MDLPYDAYEIMFLHMGGPLGVILRGIITCKKYVLCSSVLSG